MNSLLTTFRTLLTVAAIGAAAYAATAEVPEPKDTLPAAPAGKTWKLVWHDEFDGTKLDETKWEIPPDGKRRDGWWMRKADLARRQGPPGRSARSRRATSYIDGCVRTKGKFEHAFGYYVARIQLQKQPGHWSAFWLMRRRRRQGRRRRPRRHRDRHHGEALARRPGQHALHWDGYGKDHKSAGKVVKVPGVMEGFHTFGLLVDARRVRLLRRRQGDLANQGRRRLPGAAVHQAQRRDRQLGRRHRARPSCPTSSWSTTCGCTIWWRRSRGTQSGNATAGTSPAVAGAGRGAARVAADCALRRDEPGGGGSGAEWRYTSLALIQDISLRSWRPTSSTGWARSWRRMALKAGALALFSRIHSRAKLAVLDLGQNLLHLGLGLVGDDPRAAGVVAVFGRVRDAVAHVVQAALVDQVDDQLHLVDALEVGHFGLVAGLDQRLEAGLDQRAERRRRGRLARRTGRFRSLRRRWFRSRRPRVPPMPLA